MEALRWLDRVDVAGLEPLGLVLGTSQSTTYSHVSRLAGAGYVERIYDRDGSVVAITREGRRAVGAAGGSARDGWVRGAGRAHARAVSWMAALMTLRGRSWVSDREARHRSDWLVPVVWSGTQGTHRPDLGVEVEGARVAIEVELSYKAPKRLRAILAGYESEIDGGSLTGGLVYVSDRPDISASVDRARREAGIPDDRFRSRALSEVRREALERARAIASPES